MNTRWIIWSACIAGSAPSAFAQSGIATYSVAFGSPSGSNSVILAPGQSAAVFVNVAFTPGVGAGNPPVAGLSDGAFAISSQTPGSTGAGMWSVGSASLPSPWGGQLGFGKGQSGGSASSTGVSDIVWGFGVLLSLPHPYPQNPANVWHGKFTASAEGVLDVKFIELSAVGVFVGATGIPSTVRYTSQSLTGQIIIVPAPAGLAILIAPLALIARRRRSPN